MKIGDRVMFKHPKMHFIPECDNGVIVSRDENNFKRPWLVRWDHGVETRPVAAFLVPALGKYGSESK